MIEIQELSRQEMERHLQFRNYCAKMIKKGDKTRLCALLQISYPTLIKHLTGVVVVPSMQAQIIDYFDKRNAAQKRAAQYIDKRLKESENISNLD